MVISVTMSSFTSCSIATVSTSNRKSSISSVVQLCLLFWVRNGWILYIVVDGEGFCLLIVLYLYLAGNSPGSVFKFNFSLTWRCWTSYWSCWWFETWSDLFYVCNFGFPEGKFHQCCLICHRFDAEGFFPVPCGIRVIFCNPNICFCQDLNLDLFLAHLSTKCSGWAIVIGLCPSSVVVRRPSSVVRRPSCVNFFT